MFGTYTIDELHYLNNNIKGCFIVNFDPHTKPGSHWIWIFKSMKQNVCTEYFNSLAQQPLKFFNFIGPNDYIYNSDKIQ